MKKCFKKVMGATAHMFLPVFDRLQVATSYQYLELRLREKDL